ncbi:MAG: hypothetical protein LAO21_21165 [Acidobacteriia bacterium]|nr:hypothetical protein [Terriglobia bacterium]
MSENDSLSKKWYYRFGVVVALLSSLTLLFTLRKDIREAIFPQEPTTSVRSDSANLPRQPDSGGSNLPTARTTGLSATPASEISVEAPPVKAHPERYINTAMSKRGSIKRAAILLELEGRESIPNVESEISAILTKQGVEAVQSFFKPAFAQDGKAKRLFSGDWTVSDQLQLAGHVDYALIGFGKVSYSSNQELGGLMTANLELALKCLDLVSESVCGNRSFAMPGAGYTGNAALQNAVEHLQPELESFVRKAF